MAPIRSLESNYIDRCLTSADACLVIVLEASNCFVITIVVVIVYVPAMPYVISPCMFSLIIQKWKNFKIIPIIVSRLCFLKVDNKHVLECVQG